MSKIQKYVLRPAKADNSSNTAPAPLARNVISTLASSFTESHLDSNSFRKTVLVVLILLVLSYAMEVPQRIVLF